MQSSDEPKERHTLADHAFGRDLQHIHDGDADHDHDNLDDGPLDENPIWIQDHVSLNTVGIDIGSSGTQIIFSRINLRRLGEDLSSRFFVVSRETLFQSPVSLTPYQSEERIDEVRLGTIIDEAYAAARVVPHDIDTGVVILTGEALRRENAQAIAGVIAELGGDFVCATAGHHMESMLAAYGSGAARVSSDQGKRILNVDIGGGTTKIAVVDKGRVVSTAAIHIGGRLQVVDGSNVITRLDPAGRHHAECAGFSWQRGDVAEPCARDVVADKMAHRLLAALTNPRPHNIAQLYLTDPITDLGPIDGVMFSGGVAEYIYQREDRDFGDMGQRLGQALHRLIEAGALPWPVLPAGECIRATALGASEYSVQLSGNTSYISRPGTLLPRRNLQVLQPPYVCEEAIDPSKVANAIRTHIEAFDVGDNEREFALAFRWLGVPSHERLFTFAQGIANGMAERIAKHQPLFIMLDGDVAQTLGAILREELNVESDILVIDGVILWDFDYIDLGRIRMPSNTVPVTIKSLVFSEDPRVPGRRQRLHHHTHHQDHHMHDEHHRPGGVQAIRRSERSARE
jgi:ethanolamine utilization protein EutA